MINRRPDRHKFLSVLLILFLTAAGAGSWNQGAQRLLSRDGKPASNSPS
jgi:hypothetical protein